MGKYVNLPWFVGVRLGGDWHNYEEVRLKAALHPASSSLVLFGDGKRRGRWERVNLKNIVLTEEGVEDLAALLLAFLALRRRLVYSQLRQLALRLCVRAANNLRLLHTYKAQEVLR
ncbi:MAG: hypothetical protein ACTSWP_10810 [Candidatus Freyarchaeota archaeon]